MTDPTRDYDHLAERISDAGHDVAAVERALGALVIETPSWGYGDSGTRFATFQQPGRPRDVFERLDDAAEVHRLTGTAPAVALHFPWDHVDDLGALRAHAADRGLRIGAVNPNLFQDPDYKLGSITHPDAAVREKAVEHMLECLEILETLRVGTDALLRAGQLGQGELPFLDHMIEVALGDQPVAIPYPRFFTAPRRP